MTSGLSFLVAARRCEIDELDQLSRTVRKSDQAAYAQQRDQVLAGIDKALAAVPEAKRQDARFLGDKVQLYARYLLASSHHPRDLALAASVVALPTVLVVDVEEEHTAPALIAASTRRLGHTLRTIGRRR